MFIAAERPDIQFCVKECARGVQSPSARDMQRAKRICRYLLGTRDWTLKLEPWKDVNTLQMMVDSDWATDKSGSEVHVCWCRAAWRLHSHHLQPNTEHRDRRQSRQQKLRDMHSEVVHAKDPSSVLWQKSWGCFDSTATISQHTKMGLGRMKHIELRFLFVKSVLKRERFTLSKIPKLLISEPRCLMWTLIDTCARSLVWGLRNRPWRRSRVTRRIRNPLEALDCWTCGKVWEHWVLDWRNGHKRTRRPWIFTSYGSEGREGMRECDIRSELLDMSLSILQDRDVPHTCFTESFEDRSVEGLHVNSRFVSVSFKHALLWTDRQVVCSGNHAEWRMCLFLVPRLTPVERPSSLLWSGLLRAVARLCAWRGLSVLQFPVVSSIPVTVQWTCCATRLTTHPCIAQENCSCTVISIHFITPNQLSIYGAVANWCHQFGLPEEEKGRAHSSVDNKMLTSVQPEEVQLKVSPASMTPGNRRLTTNKMEFSKESSRAVF